MAKRGRKAKWVGKKTAPAKGISPKRRTAIVKKAKAGKDIGKKGKAFAGIARKAARRYGSTERGRRVAAAIMWKLAKKRGR